MMMRKEMTGNNCDEDMEQEFNACDTLYCMSGHAVPSTGV